MVQFGANKRVNQNLCRALVRIDSLGVTTHTSIGKNLDGFFILSALVILFLITTIIIYLKPNITLKYEKKIDEIPLNIVQTLTATLPYLFPSITCSSSNCKITDTSEIP